MSKQIGQKMEILINHSIELKPSNATFALRRIFSLLIMFCLAIFEMPVASAMGYIPAKEIPKKTDETSATEKVAQASSTIVIDQAENKMIDGPADSARFFRPHGITADSSGNLFVFDGGMDSEVRKISPSGNVSTIAVSPARNAKESTYERQTGHLFSPTDIAVDRLGNLYVADSGNSVIRKILPDGKISIFAGQIQRADVLDGVGPKARIGRPDGIAIDSEGNLYVTTAANVIQKITPAAAVSTFAGKLLKYPTVPVDGIASQAVFLHTEGITIDTKGNFYVVQLGRYAAIRKITPTGMVSTIVTRAQLSADLRDPEGTTLGGIAVDAAGNLYVTQPSHTRILKITPSGAISTFAGTPYCFGGIDGKGSKARFVYPEYMTIDHTGNLFVTDHVAQTIRKITPAGKVSTLAGKNGKPAYDQEQCGDNSYVLRNIK